MTIELSGPINVSGECHLWLASCPAGCCDVQPCDSEELAGSQLGQNDLLRWRRFRPLEKKQQFLYSRIAVRMVLEREFGQLAHTIRLDSDSQGCPRIVNATGDEFCRISLSHSGSVIAIVVSQAAVSVGVDVEVGRPRHIDAIRAVAVSQAEMRWMGQVGMADASLVTWVIKEAVWKSLGGPQEITAAEILVDYKPEGFNASILHPSYASVVLRVATFSTPGFQLSFAVDLTTEVSLPVDIPLLGCVAQRVSY
jgi:phosphopantetheinyl transferase